MTVACSKVYYRLPLEEWGRKFESHSRHGLSVFVLSCADLDSAKGLRPVQDTLSENETNEPEFRNLFVIGLQRHVRRFVRGFAVWFSAWSSVYTKGLY
jgi:hypothetical protein